jgi:signal peptidase I
VQETSVVPAKPVSANRQGKQKNLTREIIDTVVLTLLIFFAVHFSVQPFEVIGPSMQPGLHDVGTTHEEVLVNLLAYNFSAPKRGDIVVLYPPVNTSHDCNDTLGSTHTCFVKRIIAIPGDTIQVTVDGRVYVNGTLLSEPYIYGSTGGSGPIAGQDQPVVPPTTLGKDAYYVMGDNRGDSEDSRAFGPISRSEIIGKASAVIWPLGNFEWLPDYSYVFKSVGSGGR